MGWGIKLKNNELLKKTYLAFIGKVVVTTVSVPFIFFILLYSSSVFDFQWVYDFSPLLYSVAYHFFTSELLIVVTAITIWAIVVLILLYKLLKKVFSYVTALSKASDNLMNKDVEYVELPDELKEIENKMNALKLESLKNERAARENEQKKDELIVYLAHDIKTPLTSMIGYLSILDEIDDMPVSQRKKYVSIALNKSYKLEDLINELFDIARFNSEKIILEKEELNLNLMIEQIIDDFYPTLKELGKDIKLNTEENVKINADPDKLSRVFSNLIKNAINYSREESDIIVNIRKNVGSITVEVINKGKQIPKEKLERLFEKFYRADSSRTSKTGGSGLGLAIAKDIVELHNGTIKAVSDKDETTFCVELPVI